MEKELVKARENLFEIACFLISSAKGCFSEPRSYGPLRLLQAFVMLSNLSKNIEDLRDEFIERMGEKITENLTLALDEKKFEEFVTQLGIEVAKEIKKRIK
ncbi:MAG: DUF6092 family protein [Nitrososphaerota archaeon]|nr:DUF6092 family protein [Nitrososphaerota archaeon]